MGSGFVELANARLRKSWNIVVDGDQPSMRVTIPAQQVSFDVLMGVGLCPPRLRVYDDGAFISAEYSLVKTMNALDPNLRTQLSTLIRV